MKLHPVVVTQFIYYELCIAWIYIFTAQNVCL